MKSFPLQKKVQNYPIDKLKLYLEGNPDECQKLLQFSYDKRYMPSTFIEELDNKFQVGWFDGERKETQIHDTLTSASIDFVLFSLKRGRYHG